MLRHAPATERRQCWGCYRRRWVCDSAKPKCSKCTTAGVDCPGYGEQKPITWLRPGQVQSRRKRRSLLALAEKVPNTDDDTLTEAAGDRPDSIFTWNPPPDRALTLRSMQWDAVQAVQYYNTVIYPQMMYNQLEMNPWMVPLTSAHLIPDHIHHSLISLSLAHRILRLPRDAARADLSVLSLRQYQHIELAMRKLNTELSDETSRTSDVTLASVLVLLYAEMQQSLNPSWGAHADGLFALVSLRGGWMQVGRDSPHLRASMVALLVFFTAADTTSPPSLKGARIPYHESTEMTRELYEFGMYPWFPCAETLFTAVVDINHLRHLHRADQLRGETSFIATIHSVMDRIETFSPKQWATRTETFEEQWYLIGQIYQSAVFLYALASLKSVNALQAFPKFNLFGDLHRDRLFRLLRQALLSPPLLNGINWPLIVAGFEAAERSPEEQDQIGKALAEVSRTKGHMALLTAKKALEKYWSNSKRGWNVCFDQPYAFVC